MRMEKLDMLKKEYEEVEVPEEAMNRLNLGMKKALMEKRRKKRMQYTTFALTAAASFAIILLPNFSPKAAEAMSEIPVLDSVVNIVTHRYQEEEGSYSADVNTPELQLEGGAKLESSVGQINDEVRSHAAMMITQYEREKKENAGVYDVEVHYKVVTDTEDWFTLKVETEKTSGGSARVVQYYNLDKKTGEYTKLGDLFSADADYVSVLSEEIIRQMKAETEQDSSKMYFLKKDGNQSVFTKISEEQDFYFNQEGNLVIAFDEYEVAPGSMGSPEFIIDPEFTKSLGLVK